MNVVPPSLGLKTYLYSGSRALLVGFRNIPYISLDNRIFPFFSRVAYHIGILPLSLGFRKIPSSLSWLPDKWKISFILSQEKSIGLEDGGRSQIRGQGPVTGGSCHTWGQGPGTHRQEPGPGGRDLGPRGRNPDPGGRDLEDGSWSNLFMEYFSPTSTMSADLLWTIWTGSRIWFLPSTQVESLRTISFASYSSTQWLEKLRDGLSSYYQDLSHLVLTSRMRSCAISLMSQELRT